ncbi:MAG TPA: serine/threonine-protein kinase [Bacteriovoracaceae bacterium]|nr:serine/threonine-protein kinase [Bacteriovoracaceae bacterium]
MSEKKFERFGKYLILDHLVDGGMAKICRARYLGEQANKMVAVKMVQPQFSNDEAFVRMFQDELNITFGMLHPNIMQVYDYGKTNGQLYTAMEYIHGANLKQYLDRLKEQKKAFPVETSCYIISQVCLGLHYAHSFTDKLTGKPYNIVHRDISPHNIMLTYDGAVKVIDFGIAKANTNSESTQAGTIKGKLSYLAPEYLDGLELDCRYDEFAVGITLWELLCSRKLFQASNDLAVLKQIQQCKIIPPSEINPTVPKELDAIVMKALSKDRSHRYENLDQMNRALVRFLYSTYPDFNASDLRAFADDLFKKELASDQIKFVEYGSIDIMSYIEDMKKNESTGKVTKKEVAAAKEIPDAKPGMPETRGKVREIDLQMDMAPMKIEVESRNKTSTKKLNRMITGKTSTNAQAGLSLDTIAKNMPKGAGKTGGTSLHKKDKTTSKVASRGSKEEPSEKPSNGLIVLLLIAASVAGVVYFQAGAIKGMLGMERERGPAGSSPLSKGQKPAIDTHAAAEEVDSDTEGKVILSGIDMSMELFVNGQRHEFTGKPLKVELDKETTISVKKSGYATFMSKVILTKTSNSTLVSIPKLERARLGLLTTSQNYTAGSRLIYEEGGETIEKELPFNDMRIPEGSYHARVVNPILGTEKKVEFTIEENKKHFLE